ncbi:MAG: ChbG/HpnK family deacetylase [Burkholderiaceae bacterium]|nr:ChbG/HpnK family deacetylase [Burkholderiaceae bacterium]
MSSARKRIQICADDFGFDAGVSQGILDCLDAGRVSATSCMVLSPAWPAWAPALRERASHVDAGLHLDVNEFAAELTGQAQRSLSGWIAAAYLGRIAAPDARRWVSVQLDAFEAAWGGAPAYVDGHQHVHQLPVLRQAVVTAVQQRYGQACALRVTTPRRWRGLKAAVIGALGSGALARDCRRAGLPCNIDFAGVYGFESDADFAALVRQWLHGLPDGGLLMTHPGRADGVGARPDAIRTARARERDFWLSPQAGELLAELGVQIALCADWRR